MMKRRLSYGVAISEENLGDGGSVLLQGGLERSMRKAAELGFDSVEFHIRDPLKLDASRLSETAARLGLRVAAIGTGLEFGLNGLSLTSEDAQVRASMVARVKEHIDFAMGFGAVVFLGLIRGKCPSFVAREAWLDRLAGELPAIVSYAGERKVVLGFEPIAFYYTPLLNSADETLEFLSRPGLDSIQLLLDTHHMYIEDADMFESFRRCAGRIAHVHISDSNRRYPGAGKVDYLRVARVIDEIGYEGAVSLETLPWPTGEEAARRGLEWMRSTWGD